MLATVAQRPAHLRRIRLRPPAIQLRQIDTAIDEYLHAARSAGLPWPARRIEPDVGALHQALGQQHVVVAQENHMPACFGITDELDPLADQRLPGLIRGMRLAGHDELHGALGVGEDPQQPLRIVQQQVRPLISCETARERDRQDIRIEHPARIRRLGRCGARGYQLARYPLARVFDELLARGAAKLPDFHRLDRAHLRIVGSRISQPPIRTGNLGPERIRARPDPRWCMHTVRYITNRHLFGRPTGKQ